MSEGTKTESQIRSEEAEKLKKEGNTALSERNYSAAIEFYTKAIALTPDNHLLYSNRAAAFLSSDGGKEAAESAYADSCKCSEICPSFPKGYYRGAMALLKLERPLDAAKLLAGALSDSNRGISRVMDRREMCDFMTQCYVEHVKMNVSPENLKTDLDRSISFLNGYIPPQDSAELPPSTAKTDIEKNDAQTLAVVDFLCTHEDFCIAVANVVNAASKSDKETIDNEVVTKIASVSLSMTRGSRLVTLAYGAFYGLLPALVTYAQSTDSLDVLTSLIVSMSNTSSKFDENKRRLGRAGIVDAIKHIFDLPNDVHSKLFQAIFGSDSTGESTLTQEERETHLKDLRSCIEAVSDLVCQDESLCRDLSNLGLVSTLMQLVENAPALRAVSVSAIGSLCSNETSCAEFIGDDGIDKLYKLLISPESDAETQKEVISTLRIVAAASKLGATAVVSSKDLIDTLFARMTYGSDAKPQSESSTATSDAKGKDSGLLDEQVSALNFVSELIKSENVPSQVFVSRIPWLLESYSAADADVVTKRNVAAVIGTIAAMRQDVMPDLLRYIDSFLSWIDQNDDREVRICGMWILGSNIHLYPTYISFNIKARPRKNRSSLLLSIPFTHIDCLCLCVLYIYLCVCVNFIIIFWFYRHLQGRECYP